MKYLKHLLVAGILSMFFFSCKKDDAVPTLKISSNVREYLPHYGNLLYRDSATGILDSITATSSVISAHIPATQSVLFPGSEYYTEYCEVTLTKNSGNIHTEWFKASGYPFHTGPLISTDTCGLSLNESTGGLAFYINGNERPDYTVTIEGKTYNNVVVTTSGSNVNYWAKGKGIIKRTIITTGGAIQTYTVL